MSSIVEINSHQLKKDEKEQLREDEADLLDLFEVTLNEQSTKICSLSGENEALRETNEMLDEENEELTNIVVLYRQKHTNTSNIIRQKLASPGQNVSEEQKQQINDRKNEILSKHKKKMMARKQKLIL
jgi:hypothetical protein